jgi:hypothetical protein
MWNSLSALQVHLKNPKVASGKGIKIERNSKRKHSGNAEQIILYCQDPVRHKRCDGALFKLHRGWWLQHFQEMCYVTHTL